MSKSRLLLETDGGISEQCLQWVMCMPGTTVQGISLLVYRTGHEAYMWVLLYALSKWYHDVGSQHSPR